MKGQFRIVNEMLIFGIGVFLVVFVAQNFQAIQGPVSKVSIADQLAEISDSISTAVIKVYVTGEESSVSVKVPSDVSGSSYAISIRENRLVIESVDAGVYVTSELFKIGDAYVNIAAEDGLTGSTGYIIVSFNKTNIEIKGA